MSNKNEPTKNDNAPTLRAIPVAVLRFDGSTDVPGSPGASAVKRQMVQMNRAQYEINYLAHMRHFHLIFRPVGEGKPAEELYIHETKARSWMPATPAQLEEEAKAIAAAAEAA